MKRSIGLWGVMAAVGLVLGSVSTQQAVSAVASAATFGQNAGELDGRFGTVFIKEPNQVLQPVFSDANTEKVVDKLQRGEGVCRRLPSEYRADCMAKALRDAYQTASQPDYRGARKELQAASRALSNLVKQNADPKKPAVRVGNRTYRPVKKSAVKTVNRQATAILTETETRLLRSGTGERRKAHYQRIARAVGSTKKLFRS